MLKLCVTATLALAVALASTSEVGVPVPAPAPLPVELPESIPIGEFKLAAAAPGAAQLIAQHDLCGDLPAAMFVVPALGFDSADDACRKFGGHLANINDANFLAATTVAFQCSGPFSETWVRSWNTDTYQGACLVLSTGAAPRGGAINHPAVCAAPRKALCQRGVLPWRPDYCPWDGPCDRPDVKCKKACRKCGCNCNCQDPLFTYRGNKLPSIGPNGDFSYFIGGNYTADDGKLIIRDGQLIVDSYPFTKTSTDSFDRTKFLILTNEQYDIPENGEISVSGRIKSISLGIENNPFGDQMPEPQSDPRAATGSLFAYDFTTGYFFAIYITNERVYATYSRLEYGRPLVANYAAFDFLYPIADVRPNEYINAAIVFNGREDTVRFIINGQEKYKVGFLGTLLSRQYMTLDFSGHQEVRPVNKIQGGFGAVSLLDAYPVCNVISVAPNGAEVCVFPLNEKALVQTYPLGVLRNPRNGITPAQFLYTNENPANRLFGQGVILTVDNFSIGRCLAPLEEIPLPQQQ